MKKPVPYRSNPKQTRQINKLHKEVAAITARLESEAATLRQKVTDLQKAAAELVRQPLDPNR